MNSKLYTVWVDVDRHTQDALIAQAQSLSEAKSILRSFVKSSITWEYGAMTFKKVTHRFYVECTDVELTVLALHGIQFQEIK